MEPNTEYVKPDEILEEKQVTVPEGKVIFGGKVCGYELTPELEAKIIALPDTKDTKTVLLGEDTGDLKVVRTVGNVKVVETGSNSRIIAREVRKILHCSLKRAQSVLVQLKQEGKLKTKEERYTELYPQAVVEDPVEEPKVVEPADPQPIDDIGLSGIVVTALMDAGINTVDDLCSKTESEILAIAGIGESYLENIKDALASLGKSLKAE